MKKSLWFILLSFLLTTGTGAAELERLIGADYTGGDTVAICTDLQGCQPWTGLDMCTDDGCVQVVAEKAAEFMLLPGNAVFVSELPDELCFAYKTNGEPQGVDCVMAQKVSTDKLNVLDYQPNIGTLSDIIVQGTVLSMGDSVKESAALAAINKANSKSYTSIFDFDALPLPQPLVLGCTPSEMEQRVNLGLSISHCE